MTTTEQSDEKSIILRVKDQVGEEMIFKVKKETKMSKIFVAYSNRKGIALDQLRFMIDGERIADENTPKTLELEDNDQIDVVLHTIGGVALVSVLQIYSS